MKQPDPLGLEILEACAAGKLRSVATKAELDRLRDAARATVVKDRRVNIRLTAGDLRDIKVKAMEEGMPCQTLSANTLHQYVTGRLEERRNDPVGRTAAPRRHSTRTGGS